MGYKIMETIERAKRGVLVSVQGTDEKTVRITLDDLVQGDKANTWAFDNLVTFKDYEKKAFENLTFTDKELADFGYYIIARLYAYYKRGEL